jgi:hypothetical protein
MSAVAVDLSFESKEQTGGWLYHVACELGLDLVQLLLDTDVHRIDTAIISAALDDRDDSNFSVESDDDREHNTSDTYAHQSICT